MNALLLDTNVWLDYHMPDRPGHVDAFALVNRAIELDYDLLIASHSLKDFFYLYWQIGKTRSRASGKLSPEEASRVARAVAWACTEQIARNATVVGANAGDTWLALKLRNAHDDFEDDMILAAAMRAKPLFFVTNDKTLAAHAPVATATPADTLKHLEIA